MTYRKDDLDTRCTKCGQDRSGFEYHASCPRFGGEHLHYSCYRCGYEWSGPTLDQKEAAR